jgi:hypothetical protein
MPLGYGLMYNHSESEGGGNLRADHHIDEFGANWLTFRATRRIEAREELTIDFTCKVAFARINSGQEFKPVLESSMAYVAPACRWFHFDYGTVRPSNYQACKFDLNGYHFDPAGSYNIKVDRSEVEGFGMFATKDHKKGDILLASPIMWLKHTECVQYDYLINYVFQTPNVQDCCPVLQRCTIFDHDICFLPLGVAAISNHSTKPNMQWCVPIGSTYVMLFIALCDIPAGAELFHNYGESYWEDGTWHELEDDEQKVLVDKAVNG